MALDVIAHRGASGTRPENTLAAFRRAVELGAHMIELDVQCTRDGAVVVIHDDTLERTTDGRGIVRHHTLTELASLDAGGWFDPAYAGERLPTLDAVLAAVPIPINVELKSAGDDGLERRTLEVVEAAGALQRVVFSSFAADSLVRMRALSAAAELAVLWDRTAMAGALRLAEGVGARALHIRTGRSAPSGIASGHAAGLLVRVWTVNARADFTPLQEAGVDGVFTDYPERFLLDG
ncbi:MAG TPA: glycerophosphodiester phosphodiesterase family protein [Candidatus Binatia bacterium]|jgi:glycerophosphoryl diester phosphodiesterase|nr:glycerophosphodiester phosphodiesterase family protein [Candidatus Binatia bacterium]